MGAINYKQGLGRFIKPILTISVFLGISACKINTNSSYSKHFDYTIPVGGNSWVTNNINESSNIITNHSIEKWTSKTDTINTFFHTDKTGELKIGLNAKVTSGKSDIGVQVGNKTKVIKIGNTDFDSIYVGKFKVTEPGYQNIKIFGRNKSSAEFAEVTEFYIGGEATKGNINYVRDDFYWGRRGPSVHLSYPIPEQVSEVKWFYNEITVPEGEDVLGSYFMANGFAQGYFGIQINSETERRILFSVWSPYHTDNPDEIPDDQKIVLMRKGENVYTGEFGDEGSGGQSYYKYNWKAGTTYSFLLKGEPEGDNHTVFSAYFYAPETGQWKLIASFKRPKTKSYLTRLHSFLENFYTETGAISRKAVYSNQWVCNTSGEWTELTQAKFTADATARKNARLDYTGGIHKNSFYLKNCGFNNEHTKINSELKREKENNKPEIDFSQLP